MVYGSSDLLGHDSNDPDSKPRPEVARWLGNYKSVDTPRVLKSLVNRIRTEVAKEAASVP